MSDDAQQTLTSEQVADQIPQGWREVAGMLRTRLRTQGFEESLALVNAIAKAAEEADHHPDIDLRWGWVGLRLVSHDVGAPSPGDIGLAGEISRCPYALGACAQPEVGASMTIGIDTADTDRIRPFWMALTGHEPAKGDPDSLPSPDGQLPEIWFQDSEERSGRGRVHLDVYAPPAAARGGAAACGAAGGELVTDEFAPAWWVLSDADGNLACVCTWQARG